MMIVQSVLFFVLGVATTAFAVMLLAPVLWRRALTLSYKAARAEVPLSLTEIEADRDFLRVQHAVELCRLEEKLKEEQDARARSRLLLDTARERIHAFEALCSELNGKLDDNKLLVDDLRQKLGKNEKQLGKLSDVRLHYETQKKQFRQQQRKISRLESDNERLKEQIKAISRIDRHALKAFCNDIKEIAATVAAEVARGEGAASPIVKLTAGVTDDDSLAALIRHLLQDPKLRRARPVHHFKNSDKPVSAGIKSG